MVGLQAAASLVVGAEGDPGPEEEDTGRESGGADIHQVLGAVCALSAESINILVGERSLLPFIGEDMKGQNLGWGGGGEQKCPDSHLGLSDSDHH